MGPAVTRFILDAFVDRRFPAHMNASYISLIPKVNQSEMVSQCRSISLANVVVKVISKVVANRVKLVIGKLVSSYQCSFIPGRQSSDNIIVAQEILHSMRKKTGRQGVMALKLDLEKAYDKFCWCFLRQVLEAVGFDSHMLDIIMQLVTSVEMRVLWNGEMLDPIRSRRGLRQGDPLAPYLFVLCMDWLSQRIQGAVESGEWKPVKVSRNGPSISHLMFADDLLLFGVATETQGALMASIMKEFCDVSGQKVSIMKSHLYFSSNTPNTQRQALGLRFGIPITYDLGKYLGMPLLHGRVTADTYSGLVEKVKSRLASGKGGCYPRR